ncbi:MAG: glyoxalase [Thermoleophilaceae bacterium]|nr:glyoxalase [Thermoleophilaceae bacterium]
MPVKDLESSKRFFGQLGFEFDPQFTDETPACMVIDQNIYAMLLTEDRFRDFIDGEIADPIPPRSWFALSADSRQEVDSLVEKALAAGGRPWNDTLEQGPMYERSFRDPDGHVWEVIYMEQPAG